MKLSSNELPYYTTGSGTSFSAPHVAGVIALMLEANPQLTPAQIRDILQRTATPLTAYYIHEVGAGMLNVTRPSWKPRSRKDGSADGVGWLFRIRSNSIRVVPRPSRAQSRREHPVNRSFRCRLTRCVHRCKSPGVGSLVLII